MRPIVIVPALIAMLAGSAVAAQQPVNVSNFRSIQLLGGGSVDIRPGSRLSVTLVEGSAATSDFTVTHGQLRIYACRNRCPANYHLRVLIQSPTALDAAVSGGGDIAFAPGFAPQHGVAAAVHGGGNIDARALRLVELTAAVNGGGRIAAGDIRTLTAAINGGGSITYSGNPQITEAIHGGGSIARVR
jgi:hypothetical protein